MNVKLFSGIYWKYYVKLYYFLVHRLAQVATHALNTCAWNQWILVLIVDVIFRPFTKKIKTKTMHEMRPCIVFTTLPILDNFGNKCHLRRAERNTVIQRSRALLSSRSSACIHGLVCFGIHMIIIPHVPRSSGGCPSGGCSSGSCSSCGCFFFTWVVLTFLDDITTSICAPNNKRIYINYACIMNSVSIYWRGKSERLEDWNDGGLEEC